MKKIASFCLLWLALTSAGAGRDIFVNNLGGDDRFTGREPRSLAVGEGPVQTFSKALRLACVGDRIVLAATGKPYRESVSVSGMRLSGASGRLLVIAGNGAVLDGSAPIPVEAWRHIGGGVYRFRPPHTGFQQLFLDDAPLLRSTAASHAARLQKLPARQWRLDNGDILFHAEPGKTPEDYRLSFAALQTGITLYQVEGVTIVDLIVQGFQVDGIAAVNSAKNITLRSTTCRNNGRNGFFVGGACQVALDSCTGGGNGAAQLLTDPYSETRLRDCRLLGDTAPGWVDLGRRVYLGDTLARGGRESIVPAASPQPAESASPQ